MLGHPGVLANSTLKLIYETLLVWPAQNAAALGVLLVVSTSVEDLARLLGEENHVLTMSSSVSLLIVVEGPLVVIVVVVVVGPASETGPGCAPEMWSGRAYW